MNKEERRRKLELQAKYNQRISIAKTARASFSAKNYINAAKYYTEYLNILCEAKELDDIYKLKPEHFDEQTQVSELLLISHVYWELSRMYETVPKFKDAYDSCLDQFVKFTANQPYQVLNAELLRKYLRRHKRDKNVDIAAIQRTYSQIFVESKSCFIASYAFGENAIETNKLRLFKNELASCSFGPSFIHKYYKYSPKLIEYLLEHKTLEQIVKITLIPLLRGFAFFTQTSIFRACFFFLKLLPKRGSNLS